MKNLYALVFIIFFFCPLTGVKVSAQTSLGINYQAVARDVAGAPLATQTITVDFVIHRGSAVGPSSWNESFSPVTNQFGLFSLVIGSTSPANFDTIGWNKTSYWLEVFVNTISMGTTKFQSVPYAKHASTAGNGLPPGTTGQTLRHDGTKWTGTGNLINDGTNIGIGAATPSAPLDVQSANGTVQLLANSTNPILMQPTGAGGKYIQLSHSAGIDAVFGSNGVSTILGAATNHHVDILANGAIAMRLMNNGSVGIGNTFPNASSLVEITSTTKGILIPRMTNAQRTAIGTPAQGLMVYETTTNSFWFYNGSAWVQIQNAGGGGDWALSGNALTGGPTTPNEWLGSSTAHDFIFKTGNIERMRILSTGNVSISAIVNTGNGAVAAPAYSFSSNTNTGMYLNGSSLGFSASGTLALELLSGSNATQAYGQFRGIGSAAGSSQATPSFTFSSDPNTGIFHAALDQLAFTTNGAERMRIDASGNTGVGTTAPLLKLDARGSNAKGTTAAFQNIFQVASTDAASPLTLRMGIKTDATATNRFGSIEVDDAGTKRVLALQPSGGNVSIGSTFASNSRLEVYSSAASGGAGYFTITNTSSGSYALEASTQGNAGAAGVFQVGNASSSASAVLGFTTGIGNAGRFEISNASSTNAALYATTNGTGPAAEIAGTIKITGGSPAAGKVLTSDGVGLASWQTPAGGITGSGTPNYIPKWTGASTLSSTSLLLDNGTDITSSGQINISNSGNYQSLSITEFGAIGAGVNLNATDGGRGYTIYSTNASDGVPGLLKFEDETAGATRMTINAAGNVGIGTTSPSVKLEVSGKTKTIDFQMTNGAAPNYVLKSFDALGNAVWADPATLFAGGPWTDGGTVIYPTTLSDFVGIGTAAPTVPLQVNNTSGQVGLQVDGTDPFWSSIYVNATAAGAQPNYGYLQGGTYKAGHRVNAAGNWLLDVNGQARVTVLAGGNVGIATTSPQDLLDVYRANTTANDPGQLRLSNGSSHAYFNSYDNGAGTSFLDINPMPVNGTDAVLVRLFRKTTTTGTVYFSIHDGSGAATQANVALSGNSHSFINVNTGNVGIGNNTPGEKLDVTGNVQFSNALMPAGNAGNTGEVLVSQGTGAAPVWSVSAALPGGSPNQTLRYGATQWVAAGNLLNDGTNIGIGINPSALLHLSAASSTSEIKLNNSAGSPRTDLTFSQGAGSASQWGIINEGTDFRIQDWTTGGGAWTAIQSTTGTRYLYLAPAQGNVSVGTSSISSTDKLTVEASSNNAIYVRNSNVLAGATKIGIDISMANGGNYNEGVRVTSSGATTNYGFLGTANGSAQVNFGGSFSASGGTTATNYGLYASASGGSFNYAAVFDQGNVGIGITNPTAKLQVDGTNVLFNNPSGAMNLDITGSVLNGSKLYVDGKVLAGVSTPSANTMLAFKDGHVQSQQTTAPTVAPVNCNCAPTLSNATDVAGRINFAPGASATAGAQVTVTFNKPYAVAPIVVLTPYNSNAATSVGGNASGIAKGVYVTSTTAGFTINYNIDPNTAPDMNGLSNQFTYYVIETQ